MVLLFDHRPELAYHHFFLPGWRKFDFKTATRCKREENGSGFKEQALFYLYLMYRTW
jgi:hypothetical protein